MSKRIINRGRGPEIEGTRITVYDVLDYSTQGHDTAYIAESLGVSPGQVQAALHYIEEHEEEVMAAYQRILDRIARGNAPEIEAMREESHQKLLARRAELLAAKSRGVNGEGNPGRR